MPEPRRLSSRDPGFEAELAALLAFEGAQDESVDRVVADILRDCLLYTSDAADERSSVDLGGRRIIKTKKKEKKKITREKEKYIKEQ